MDEKLTLPKPIFDEVVQYLSSTYPEEGCGLLAGFENRVSRFYPIENVLHSPVRYQMNPKEQVLAFIDTEERGEWVQAVVHSHPNGPSVPSETDIREATYPELVYLICSFQATDTPIVRGFRIAEGTVVEVELLVV